ncbi:hypothetical protein BCR35DRAFT_298134 [Leucosporidium creatinivorum]|uniref:DUF7729 domain-containing protein n=1 Tax=Leucosporidium creatinivorum TaxID=106004 RepID=A0A1Y2G3Z0_9BASI|nr:hypothetical protein BCR35DRAFT_298134 [Leucosporidium creatinivorum]
MLASSSTSTSSTAPARPARPRRLARLACLCGIALVALASLPGAEASHLAAASNDDLPEGVQWAMGDGLTTMTSREVDGAGARRSKRAIATSGDDQATTTSSSASRKSAATKRSTTVKEAETTAVRMAANAASVPSEQSGTSTTEGTSGGVGAAIATTTITRTASATSALATSTAVPTGYQLPEAFDSTLGTNFTGTACPSFFATFLADPDFIACAPFSLLISTSSAFFTAERSPYSLLPYVLDASCSASNATCSNLMSQLAVKIRLSNTCGPDLSKGNPLVTEALMGFQNYNLYREAGCQKNNSTGQYCFAQASAESEPDDLYFYYLPEGTSLPSGTTSGCDDCTKGLLQIYSNYATNSTLAISKTYAAGRVLANQACGPTFAPLVAATTSSDAHRKLGVSLLMSLGGLAVGISVVMMGL